METKRRIEQVAQLTVVAILVVGCFLVLQPFLTAVLFAVVVCASTWPVFAYVRRWVGGRGWLAALLMALLFIVLVVGPVALLAFSLADGAADLADAIRQQLDRGPIEPPDWLTGLPLIGPQIDSYWHKLAQSREELVGLLRRMIDPAKNFLFHVGALVGQGLMQILLAVFIMFFFYRDGEMLMARVYDAAERLSGGYAKELLETIHSTVVGVMHGMLGTALAQGIVATIGFLVAGVPAAFLLGAVTFLLSMIPIGPPLVWGGAAAWLVYQDETGWAIFMVLWGLVVVSSVDNFLKPLLISRSSSMPLVLIVLGVFGGVLAFGFIGLFIGPTLLALALSLSRRWLPPSGSTPVDAGGIAVAPEAPDKAE